MVVVVVVVVIGTPTSYLHRYLRELARLFLCTRSLLTSIITMMSYYYYYYYYYYY